MSKITRPQSIKDEDRLIPEDLLAGTVEGEWVRVPLYSAGHRVSRVGHSSFCGMQLVIDEMWWENFRVYLERTTGRDPGEWYLIHDRRTNGQCKPCARKDIMFDEEQPEPAVISVAGDYAPFVDPTPADQLANQRFLTKVAWLVRELDATIEAA